MKHIVVVLVVVLMATTKLLSQEVDSTVAADIQVLANLEQLHEESKAKVNELCQSYFQLNNTLDSLIGLKKLKKKQKEQIKKFKEGFNIRGDAAFAEKKRYDELTVYKSELCDPSGQPVKNKICWLKARWHDYDRTVKKFLFVYEAKFELINFTSGHFK